MRTPASLRLPFYRCTVSSSSFSSLSLLFGHLSSYFLPRICNLSSSLSLSLTVSSSSVEGRRVAGGTAEGRRKENEICFVFVERSKRDERQAGQGNLAERDAITSREDGFRDGQLACRSGVCKVRKAIRGSAKVEEKTMEASSSAVRTFREPDCDHSSSMALRYTCPQAREERQSSFSCFTTPLVEIDVGSLSPSGSRRSVRRTTTNILPVRPMPRRTGSVESAPPPPHCLPNLNLARFLFFTNSSLLLVKRITFQLSHSLPLPPSRSHPARSPAGSSLLPSPHLTPRLPSPSRSTLL